MEMLYFWVNEITISFKLYIRSILYAILIKSFVPAEITIVTRKYVSKSLNSKSNTNYTSNATTINNNENYKN